MITDIRERHVITLEAIGLYKFLTVKQLIMLWIRTNRQNMNVILKDLLQRRRPLIGVLKFWVIPWIWRLDYVYYLTTHWVDLLEENENLLQTGINYPIWTSIFFRRDYFHRISCIDFQIRLRQEIGKVWWIIKVYFNYYDRAKKKVRIWKSVTRIKTKIDIWEWRHIIPDSVFKIKILWTEKNFMYEHSNWKDIKKIIRQLWKHAYLLYKYIKSWNVNIVENSRILCVFEHKTTQEAVMQRLQDDMSLKTMAKYFLFKTEQEVMENIIEGWANGQREIVSLLEAQNDRSW